jgi:pyrroloquinoline quinone biosynthesis protein B
VIVRVLGSAAGGGVPQWNCACANCRAARDGRAPRRTQSGLAISADRKRWLLLNCSPDVAAQIEGFEPLQPQQPRGTPIAGMLLTDANVDHLGGLAVVRQSGNAAGFRVRSSAVVRAIATAQPAFAPFAAPPHRWLELKFDELAANDGADDLVGNTLAIRTIAVPGTTPGYDGRRRERGAVVAYEIAEHDGRNRLLFAPVFAGIDDELGRAIQRAEAAFLDGTFFSDDELLATGLLPKRARQLGHQPVGGSDGTLAQLRGVGTRVIFAHLNNSNPMLDPNSPAHTRVREGGAEIAYDGMELTL